jgi:hypothetical protein
MTSIIGRREVSAKSKFVMVPCERHLPRGRTFVMGEALGDLFWEDEGGSRVQFASCRECAAGEPAYAPDEKPKEA